MQKNLAQALAWVDEDEGPELNIGGSEPGGSSKHGVSMETLRAWHSLQKLPPPTMDDMRLVDATLAAQVYTEMYAKPIRFDDLPGGVDYRLLDIEINLGVTGGRKALQLALGVFPVDGVLTDDLIKAASIRDPYCLVSALSAVWITKKHESANWEPSAITLKGYGHGWSNRNVKATGRAVSLL